VGGAAMVIENNKNGILIPAGDVTALRDAMLKMIEDSEFANLLSIEAVKVRQKYDVSKICKRWIDII
jgi:glycosyltransferase involved in cell wall biosynthesis